MSRVLPDESTETAYLGTKTADLAASILKSSHDRYRDNEDSSEFVERSEAERPTDSASPPKQSAAKADGPSLSTAIGTIQAEVRDGVQDTPHTAALNPLTEETLRHAIPYIPTSVIYACVKRVVDIVGAMCGLLILSPVMAICALWIKLHDGGPIYFRQQRVGERGELFEIVKFRSMVVNADALKAAMMELNEHADDRTFKIFNDPRVTPVGRVMRRLSLDELPQFWNVLMGQMSLVGPRPALLKEVLLYDHGDLLRLSVKPGLTCIWQVSGRSRLDFTQQVELDKEYIESRSVWNDFKLIALTFPAVFCGDGAA